MGRSSFLRLFKLLLVSFLLHTAPAQAVEQVLQPGTPFETTLASQTFASDLYVDVPSGAQSLTVAIAGASGDLDLYLKHGSPVTGSSVEEWDADTDYLAGGPTANETITVTTASFPPLVPGRWYVGTLNWNTSTAKFTLTATIQAATGVTMPIPRSQEEFSYLLTQPATVGTLPPTVRPVSVGSCSPGTEALDVGVVLNAFSAPVDVYVGYVARNVDPELIYILRPDGTFQPHTTGLIPWKSGIALGLDETFFSGIDASQLPHGTYEVLVGVTPAGSTRNYYIWRAVASVPGACAPAPVPDGSAGYVRGEIVVPGATIVIGGKEYQERAALSGNAMVGVIKDGKVYFYHPAQGHAELNEETSARAVGYFLAGVEVGVDGSAKVSASKKVVAPGDSFRLDTGMTVEATGNRSFTLNNYYRRWGALRQEVYYDDGTLRGVNHYYLAPRGSYIPTNVLEFAERLYHSNIKGVSQLNVSYDLPASFQTFGSPFRILPLFLTDHPPQVSLDAAMKADSDLFTRVYVMDMIEAATEGIQHIAGMTVKEECMESFISDMGLGTIKAFLLVLATADESNLPNQSYLETAQGQAIKSLAYSTIQGLVKCGTVVGSAGVLDGVYQYLDRLALIKWFALDFTVPIVGIAEETETYDEFSIEKLQIADCKATGDLEVGKDGVVSFSCSAWGAEEVVATLLGDMKANDLNSLTYDPKTAKWSTMAIVQPLNAPTSTVEFVATNSAGRQAVCETTIEVKNPDQPIEPGDSIVSFTDATGAWTITLEFPKSNPARVKVVSDGSAYTSQWTKVLVDGLDSLPSQYDGKLPVRITVEHASDKIVSWNLYENEGVSDPEAGDFKKKRTYDLIPLETTTYYWLEMNVKDVPEGWAIFRLFDSQ